MSEKTVSIVTFGNHFYALDIRTNKTSHVSPITIKIALYLIINFIFKTSMQILKTILGPMLSYVLYYYDIFSDVYNTIISFQNCQPEFGAISLVIIVTSYLTTVVCLKYTRKETFTSSLCYPFKHSKNTLNTIKNNFMAIYRMEELPQESKEEMIFGHQVVFLEALSESILQICMSCIKIRQYGISADYFEAFMQVSGLLTSIISTCLAFSKVRKILE